MASTLIDFFVTILLAEGLGMWYVYSTLIGAFSGATFNCAFNYKWVFFKEGLRKKKVVVRYYLVWVGSIAINTLGTYLLTEIMRHHFVYSKIITSVFVAIFWNFILQKKYVYKSNNTPK